MKSMTMRSSTSLLGRDAEGDEGNVAGFMYRYVLLLLGMLNIVAQRSRQCWKVFGRQTAFAAWLGLFCLLGACAASQKDPFVPENFVLIRGGEFTMGSPEGEVGSAEARNVYQEYFGIDYSETQHQVKVSDFSMSKYSVTIGEFRRFVEATGYKTDAEREGFSVIWSGNEAKKGEGVNWRDGVSDRWWLSLPRWFRLEENHPVLHVSWNDAVSYCEWMTKQTGKKFRLPTEAEREYACRAGTTTPFNTGENLTTDQANYDGNYPYSNNPKGVYRESTVPVNSFAPNAWGLYNMHGNVWEWCSDWFGGRYYDECKESGTVTNPAGPATGSNRVLRGGGWDGEAEYCRSAYRNNYALGSRYSFVGFRLVFVP